MALRAICPRCGPSATTAIRRRACVLPRRDCAPAESRKAMMLLADAAPAFLQLVTAGGLPLVSPPERERSLLPPLRLPRLARLAALRALLPSVLLGLAALIAGGCTAQQNPNGTQTVVVNRAAAGTGVELIVLITLISIAPALLLMVTSFTRIVVVLGLLRNAIGVPQLPPNQVLLGLALFLTIFIMAPQWQAINAGALQPYLRGTVDDVPTYVIIPAFMISELKTAFQMGFILFVPFLIIDLVVSSALLAMGMMMLPPTVISLPFKILLFVLTNGWSLIAGSLVSSYG